MGLSISDHSQVSFLYPNRGIYWGTVAKTQRQRGLMWPCVQGSKTTDPRRGEAEVNKANQRLTLISSLESPSIGCDHPRDRLPPSIPTRQDNAALVVQKRIRHGYGLVLCKFRGFSVDGTV